MPKYVFCTGGVVSSVGKGVTAASIGRILKSRGISVSIQKLDPYINVDPGTMSPYQHGEVFVTDDGAETDLDLGHYERFTDENLSRVCNVTTGQVYASVIRNERRGKYLGGTIQVIPHVTDEIKRRIRQVGEASKAQVIIVEVGGTTGDIESLPFLEALRQMRKDLGRKKTLFVHVTWLPLIGATGELKTKPTQHSVREVRSIGIQPDVIIARADHPIADELLEKIALFCDVEKQAVIPLPTADVLYAIPLLLEEAHLGDYLVKRLRLSQAGEPDMREWRKIVERIRAPKPSVSMAIVGKYTALHDAYMSVREALNHAAWECGRDVEVVWIPSGDLEEGKGWDLLERVDGIVVPGGFGPRGIEGKIAAAGWARKNKVPYLGLCLGMQVMCIELARDALGDGTANSTEFDPGTQHPIIDLMPDQQEVVDKGGTMRLGLYPCHLQPGTLSAAAYGIPRIDERHRHRFEINNWYRDVLGEHGLILSGLSPDGRLVEIVEMADHPLMIGCQFHPEFRSRPNRPHPLFVALIEAAIEHSGQAGSG
ncbi:MAG: CTP synthase [Ardenticatenales bacterium]|nr:CTP synthase [Ardenticatenales bacterium]